MLALIHRRLWIGLLAALPWAVLAPTELWYVLAFGKPSDAHAIGVLFETDWQEARAFAGGLALPLAAATGAALLLALAAVRIARAAGLEWHHRSRSWLCAAALAALVIPVLTESLTGEVQAADSFREPGQAGDEVASTVLSPSLHDLSQTYPAGVPIRLAEFGYHRATLQVLSRELAGFRFGATQDAARAVGVPRQVHVLVVGETGRPDRWQVNGYSRQTSPRLAAEPDVSSFGNMISPWAWTRMSVPEILTRKPGADARPFFAERSAVAAFREAGFRTYWFSNQSPMGQHDSSIALHAHEADEVRFINPGSYKIAAALDGELLTLLRQALARDEPRQFIVLHTLGGHYNYSHRYPPEFERFVPSLRHEAAPSLHDRRQREAMGNAYDNSVLYTDHVLGEVIEALRQSGAEATMFYVADHGENLFDGDCKLSGHGHGTERDFRVPAFFWNSGPFAARHGDKIVQMRSRLDAPLSTENVFHSLLDAADIRYADERLESSVFHPSWQAGRRIVQNGLDFDRAAREPTCLTLEHAPPSAR